MNPVLTNRAQVLLEIYHGDFHNSQRARAFDEFDEPSGKRWVEMRDAFNWLDNNGFIVLIEEPSKRFEVSDKGKEFLETTMEMVIELRLFD